jgi:hypothetical protein
VTDYSEPQSIIDGKRFLFRVFLERKSRVHDTIPVELYDQCAVAGFQLPVLTFPGQNSIQPLSSVVLPSTSQSTVSFITFAPSVIQSVGPGPATPATQASTQAGIPTSSLSSGARSVETSYFNLFKFAVAMLGTSFYFAV